MSKEFKERNCQWEECKNKASKRWTDQVAEVSHKGAKIKAPIHHADLCDRHLWEVKDVFGGHVLELSINALLNAQDIVVREAIRND
jgi:hypothetical protein